MASPTPFRLFVLGELPPDKCDGELVVLADYRQIRAVARSPLVPGETTALRAAIQDLRGFVEMSSPSLDRRQLELLGGSLFDLVILGAVRDLFVTATAQREELVPFELFIESSALASWPWEYLFDASTRMFVCREFHPISRGVFGLTFATSARAQRACLRVLVVIGSAIDDDELDASEEVALVERVFATHLKQGTCELVAERLTVRELTTRLQQRRGELDILHFLGHAGFDVARGEGFLRLRKAGPGETTKLYANDLAQACAESGIRLAFLNGCETARTAVAESPARSSVAAALLGRGIAAVVAHQFAVPNNGAHFFAGVFYEMLAAGSPLGDAVRAGRTAMGYTEDGRFPDWGIPVLYTRDPQAIVFARVATRSGDTMRGDVGNGGSRGGMLESLSAGSAPERAPAAAPRAQTKVPRPLTVAIVDIDARAGFLGALLEAANRVQRYYDFHIAYLPVPLGAMRTGIGGTKLPQLFVPAIEDFAAATPDQLGADCVCFLTCHPIAGVDEDGAYGNHFAAPSERNPAVSFVSTADLRDFARAAGTTFAKTALMVCLSIVVAMDARWSLEYHDETEGCLFDYCQNRSDMIVGLRKMRFDHAACRAKITDERLLAAIDAIIALDG